MNTSAHGGLVYDGNSACLMSSILLGLVSLYTGLFGVGGTPTVAVSAVSGTFSLVLAMAPVFRLATPRTSQNQALNPPSPVHTINGVNPVSITRASAIECVKTLLSSEEIVRQAKRLRGKQAKLLMKLLGGLLSLGHDFVDPHCRFAAAGLLYDLIDANMTSSSNTVRAVRQLSVPSNHSAEISAFFSARHPNLAIFADAEERPRVAEPLPRAGVGAGHDLSPLDIFAGVTAAVAYLHAMDVPIVHGDIRAANIRIDTELRRSILELPFDHWTHRASTTYAITHDDIARHLAPEQLYRRSPWSESISESADVYSLAMTLLELMTGAAPFADVASSQDVISAVQHGLRPLVPAETVERMFRSSHHAHQVPDSPGPTSENAEIISTVSTSRKANMPLRDAIESLNGLLTMMWAQLPEQRPAAHQVESRFEELARLEEIV